MVALGYIYAVAVTILTAIILLGIFLDAIGWPIGDVSHELPVSQSNPSLVRS